LPSARDAAELLREQAARVEDPTRRALLLSEALLCMGPETAAFDTIAEEAWRADPELPWAADLAEVAARMRGDRASIGRWLSRQRERSEGSAEAALSSIREARFLALTEPALAAERLRQLQRPERLDLALREQIEALEPGSVSERVEFRWSAAAQASARGRERLLAEVSELEHAQGNTRAAVQAARELSSRLGRLRVEAWARDPEDLAWLSAEWGRELDQLQDDPAASIELLERLARLDRERGAGDRARIWRQRLLEQGSVPVATLRFLVAESMLAGSEGELERCAARLAEQLGDRDAQAQLFLAARLRIDRGGLADSGELAERATAQAVAPLWGLRSSSALARSAGDDRRQLAHSRELRERARQPLDAATLSLRAAEAAGRLNELEVALAELERAIEIAPEHLVVLSMRAELLERQGRAAEAAEAFETLAATSQCQPWRVEALYRAALLWLDRLEDRERAIAALEEAAAVGLPHAGVQERLRALRPAGVPESDAPAAGLDAETPELARALELRAAGQIAEARAALDPLLARRSDHVEALHLSAALLLDSGEPKAAERRWRQIEALPLPRSQRLRVLRALAGLYERALADPERARRVYREILAEDVEDDATRRKLVKSASDALQLRQPLSDGSAARAEPFPHELAALRQEAIQQQRELMLRAADDDQRRQTLLELVPLLEHNAEAQREAETLLEQAHRTWPDNPQVLAAQVEHYRRLGNANTARVLIERAVHGARNAVLAGRLEPALFRTLEQAARLGGDAEGSRLAQAALAALEARTLRLAGAGARAGQQRFDDLIAPAPLSSGFRRLLYGAGAAIERAYAADPSSMNLTPMPQSQAAQVRSVAAAFGVQELRVAISDEVGCDCISLYGSPTLIVFGRALLAHENPRFRDFLLLRSLKIAQVNAWALSRMSATELWSAVVGFLACFSPPWRAEGQDAQRLVTARNRIRPHVTATLNRELTAMTAALTSNIVPQAAQLGDALWRWASRVALFGVGELGVALDGLAAAATGRPALPKDLEGRIRWIAGSSSARDLVGYSISEAYTEARRRAGLVGAAR
jgi:tetratricopeptide (TPR) repeat protein